MSKNSQLRSQPPRSVGSQNRRRQPKWQRRLLYYYRRFVRLRGTPEYIAIGLAVGIFAGVFPIFGLQGLAAIALAILFRGSKLMAYAGTWVSNPFTSLPIYWLNFEVGQWLLGSHEAFTDVSWQSWQQLMELQGEFLKALFLGSFVVGLVWGVGSYFLGVWLIRRWRAKRKRRLAL